MVRQQSWEHLKFTSRRSAISVEFPTVSYLFLWPCYQQGTRKFGKKMFWGKKDTFYNMEMISGAMHGVVCRKRIL